jgi:phosphoribosylformylglycinamidine synthase I
MAKMVKAVVITGCGINCDKEMAVACKEAGFEVETIHASKLFGDTFPWSEAQLLLFPGGFSFGDELGAAKVFANRLLGIKNRLQEFVDQGNCILGICNGFQLLVKLGLLPGDKKEYREDREESEGNAKEINENSKKTSRFLRSLRDLRGSSDSGVNIVNQTASLACNDTGRFEARWVNHLVVPSKCIFTQGLESLYLPIRHGEGKFVTDNTELLFRNQQVVMQYEKNPNGSMDSIAAICDPTGRILGMMAHPEAALYFTQDPRWTRMKESLTSYGSGFAIFKNALNYLKEQECYISKQP